MLFGADISYSQGKQTNWDAVRLDFLYARASYGDIEADVDDNFIFNHDGAKSRGIPFGAYHYWLADRSPSAQVALFVKQTNGYQGQLVPMVDVEDPTARRTSPVSNVTALAEFLHGVEEAFKVQPIIYTASGIWASAFGNSPDFNGHRLWVANYTDNPHTPPSLPGGWSGWNLYQYTNKLSTPGFSAPIDGDCYIGNTIADLVRHRSL